jgi:hypothetical protein
MWPFRKKATVNMKESQKAILAATQNLRQTRERGPEVSRVAQTLQDIRERNHFAEQLHSILGGR